ncbi:MAG: ShlB/FhaC/HecB family hemolysin secretion/activation protein [Leptolyngbya sp. UWPOB_LEPTO1]|uniref:ShlB/FhaC/HecB family hemolysin secretion/activation protein n=1 Tax=Leptolyngbya sp. UWPOB_LEPTO1 TaxID=2815653 RepID=UPI001ACB3CF9|nr:ShlB/FhaC/HecB family hemolysin secretion/activation protein [Leptolyngbya sp. UWPOB_LEPTO1]MBN8559656.1 ShlB/FhaC/HecB family hemolysin secretion/activation protein [Leptolyngbya sp. UWPOB_LEPTO1]
MASHSRFQILLLSLLPLFHPSPALAQRVLPIPPPQDLPRPQPPQPSPPEPTSTPLPPPDQLLPGLTPPTPEPPENVSDTIQIKQIEIVGSTVFRPQDFAEITRKYVDRRISFAELLQIRTEITELYIKQGYVTSAAVLPPQVLTGGTVKIQIIEGAIASIDVIGTRRLNPAYIRSRIGLVAQKPLNVNRLLEGLRLLQLDPLIASISADLQAGTRPGTSVLQITIAEAKTLTLSPLLDNSRSPSVGSFRRQLEVSQANLLGLGDGLRASYTNTDGSNGIDLSYIVPFNARNGTLRLAYGSTRSRVIEEPFDILEIQARSRYYELTLRQPIVQRPTNEFAIGWTFSRQESQTELGLDNIGPFPLSPGADEQGRTQISALRFFQEYVQRSDRQVFAARSQFSLGLNFLNSTINEQAPDSRFFAWRGQAQWTRLLARDSLFLVRGDMQLADRTLVPLEQIGVGGQETVRGYRQDALLTDNGFLFSTELRLPIFRPRNGLVQLTPFVDLGTGWNRSGDNPEKNTLVGAGLGLLWRQGENFSARIDFGFPLVSIENEKRTLQENGIYFSIRYSPSF